MGGFGDHVPCTADATYRMPGTINKCQVQSVKYQLPGIRYWVPGVVIEFSFPPDTLPDT